MARDGRSGRKARRGGSRTGASVVSGAHFGGAPERNSALPAEPSRDSEHWIIPPSPLQYRAPPAFVFNPVDPATAGGRSFANSQYGADVYINERAVWQTPLFDLRADFKSGDAYQPNAQTIDSKGVVVGDFAHLFVQIEGLANVALSATQTPFEYRISIIEFGATMDPTRADKFGESTASLPGLTIQPNAIRGLNYDDITARVFQQPAFTNRFFPQQTVFRVSIPGTLRYWGCALVFDRIEGGADRDAVLVGPAPSTPSERFIISGALH